MLKCCLLGVFSPLFKENSKFKIFFSQQIPSLSKISSMIFFQPHIKQTSLKHSLLINKIISYRSMKANFDISLPSIPGKSIKFKIQDIKSAAFGTQKSRFPDDKSQLVKKFVDSFHNFHEPKQNDETETQAETQLSKSFVMDKKQTRFRSMIPENKKFLLPIYNQLKKKQKEKLMAEEQPQTKGGFTFNKFEEKTEITQKYFTHHPESTSLTDNYYFTQNQIQYEDEEEQKIEKKPKPSASFKNQTRKKVYERLDRSIVPGPGAYLKDKPKQKSKAKKKRAISTGAPPEKDMDYNHLKELITKVIAEEPQEEQQVQGPKQKKNDHMFVMDDRDRFGQQKFPIAPRLKVPGPGTYDINNTIEDRAKKLIVVQQQRKLLKQWFNN